jgi:hypothetical protein
MPGASLQMQGSNYSTRNICTSNLSTSISYTRILSTGNFSTSVCALAMIRTHGCPCLPRRALVQGDRQVTRALQGLVPAAAAAAAETFHRILHSDTEA